MHKEISKLAAEYIQSPDYIHIRLLHRDRHEVVSSSKWLRTTRAGVFLHPCCACVKHHVIC